MIQHLEPVSRLTRDIREAALTLGDDEARFLVDAYYIIQEDRKRSFNQLRALDESEEPNAVLQWFAAQNQTLERNLRTALDTYSDTTIYGRWAKSIYGIGPVITAGLMAHINIREAPTVANIWRLAGMDPSSEWLGKERAKALVASIVPRGAITPETIATAALAAHVKPERLLERAQGKDGALNRDQLVKTLSRRPWNAGLRTLAWKIGESIVKHQQGCPYAVLYSVRKTVETQRNEAGAYTEEAQRTLREKTFRADTEALKWYTQGMLPPGRIHARAKRYATKMFLSHFWEIWYFVEHGQVGPLPYILSEPRPEVSYFPFKEPGHWHYIWVPNAEMVPGFIEAKSAQLSAAGLVGRSLDEFLPKR